MMRLCFERDSTRLLDRVWTADDILWFGVSALPPR